MINEGRQHVAMSSNIAHCKAQITYSSDYMGNKEKWSAETPYFDSKYPTVLKVKAAYFFFYNDVQEDCVWIDSLTSYDKMRNRSFCE